jgi:predicted PurR-regulated permease PerM
MAPERWAHDPWLTVALAASAASLAWLFAGHLSLLLFAVVVVVVTWPIYERVCTATGGRRGIAALLTTGALGLVVGVPLGLLVFRAVQESIALVGAGMAYVEGGGLAARLASIQAWHDWMPAPVAEYMPEDFDLQAAVAGPLRDSAIGALRSLGNAAPRLVGRGFGAVADGVLFLLSVLTLYVEGPALIRVMTNLSPLDQRYDRRLFEVFREFANNVVMGTLATAAIQGALAGIGYKIAGVDDAVFFGLVTGLCAFVPVLGTLLVWVPLSIVVALDTSVGWGLFVAGWGVGVSQIDNVIRPFFLRGSTRIHPLAILLAVVGGIGWMGLPGGLVGPVMVALFYALYTLFVESRAAAAAAVPTRLVAP